MFRSFWRVDVNSLLISLILLTFILLIKFLIVSSHSWVSNSSSLLAPKEYKKAWQSLTLVSSFPMWNVTPISTDTLTLSFVGHPSIYKILRLNTYRSIELHCILSDHSSNSLVRAIAAKIARIHLTIGFSPNVFQSNDTMRNIKLVVAATGRIDDYHDRNTFCVLVADETRTFIRVIGV